MALQNVEMGSPAVKSLSQLKTGADLKEKVEHLKRGRQYLDAQWKLNLAFYKGRQYTYYNKSARRLENLPVEDGEKPRYRVRIVNNQIVTGAHSLLAKFTKTKPVMNATPTSGSDADHKAADIADKLLEHWWTDFNLDDKLSEALLWSIVTGQGYWKITWDADAGSQMRFLLDPNGQPITDTALADLFRAELENVGVAPQEQVVYMGDIKVEAISPFDVFIDDSAKTFDEAKYVICVHYMTPEEIKDKWKYDCKPDSIGTQNDQLLPYGVSKSQEPTTKAVYVGYFLPQPTLPNGRYVVWVDEKIVEDERWPYPIDKLPLVKFPGVRTPGSVYDGSVVEQAIPIQKDLNKTLSQLIEYKNLTLKPRVWAPVGSLNGVRLTSEPGAVYEYNLIGERGKPEVEQLPSIPPYVFEHLERIRRDLREVFGIVDITEGTPPPNVEAGIAIDLLQEMATDRLAPTIVLIERSLVRAAEIMLAYAQKYYQEPRVLKIHGSGGHAKAKRFNQADLQGGVSIRVETGSALPRTRAGRQARILDYVDRGVIRPDQAYKYLDIADLEGLAGVFQADEDLAYREHDRILAGEPVNTVAMEQAMAMLEAGEAVDQNGEPITDPEAAEAHIHMESLKPLPYENLQVSLDVHGLFMKSQSFEVLPPNIKSDFLLHYEQTLEAFNALPAPMEFKPVTPTLQIKSTAGPTATSRILEKAGIQVTPQDMEEPPLETWVSDKIDEPDADEAGNDPLTPLDMQLKQLDIEAKLADARERSGRQPVSEMAEAIDTAEKAEMARLHVRKATADAELAEKKARQSDFKPNKNKTTTGGSRER
jgi:hypothetical protein